MRDAFIQGLLQQAEQNPRIMLVTGDLGFGVLDEFRRKLPKQFLNVGVAEQNMTGVATGLALSGRIVFTYSIGNFPTLRCLEQIRNDAAYHDANVKVVSVGGGFTYGALGMSHHATEDLSIMRALPIPVVAPGDDWEAFEAAGALVRQPGTCYIRVERTGAEPDDSAPKTFEIGVARTVRAGQDVTLISSGGILGEAISAAKVLSARGIEARVISMHTVSPIDSRAVLAAARETAGIVTIEENTVRGGLGGAVAEICMESGIFPGFFRMIGLKGEFATKVGCQQFLRNAYNMDSGAIVDAAAGAFEGCRTHAHKNCTGEQGPGSG